MFKHLHWKYDVLREEMYKKFGDRVIFAHEITRCSRKNELEKSYSWTRFSSWLVPSILLGEVVHEGFAKIFGEQTAPYVKPLGDYIISGSPDAMINDKPAEVKFQRTAPESPKEHHIDRLKLYMWLTGSDEGYLIYLTPERVAAFTVNETVSDVAVMGMLKKMYPRYEWECRLCQFSGICEFAQTERRNRD